MRNLFELRWLATIGLAALFILGCNNKEKEEDEEITEDETVTVVPVDYYLTGKLTIRSHCTTDFRLLPETVTVKSSLEGGDGYYVVGTERVTFVETTADGRVATYRIKVSWDPSRGEVRRWTVPMIDEDICSSFTDCGKGKICGIEKVKEVTRDAGWNDPTTTFDQIVTCDCM